MQQSAPLSWLHATLQELLDPHGMYLLGMDCNGGNVGGLGSQWYVTPYVEGVEGGGSVRTVSAGEVG